MGNPQPRALNRPADRGKPCVCDVLVLTAACEGETVRVQVSTDLPANTRVAVVMTREFKEHDGHTWLWTCHDNAHPVQPQPDGLNGFVLHFTLDELDTQGLNMYRHLKRAMDVVLGEPPTPHIAIQVDAPNTEHRFGLCNRRMTGKAVTVQPGGHRVTQSLTLAAPVAPSILKKLGF